MKKSRQSQIMENKTKETKEKDKRELLPDNLSEKNGLRKLSNQK